MDLKAPDLVGAVLLTIALVMMAAYVWTLVGVEEGVRGPRADRCRVPAWLRFEEFKCL